MHSRANVPEVVRRQLVATIPTAGKRTLCASAWMVIPRSAALPASVRNADHPPYWRRRSVGQVERFQANVPKVVLRPATVPTGCARIPCALARMTIPRSAASPASARNADHPQHWRRRSVAGVERSRANVQARTSSINRSDRVRSLPMCLSQSGHSTNRCFTRIREERRTSPILASTERGRGGAIPGNIPHVVLLPSTVLTGCARIPCVSARIVIPRSAASPAFVRSADHPSYWRRRSVGRVKRARENVLQVAL